MSATVDKEALKEAVISELKTCFDPEIPVNIYDLGMIYDIDVDEKRFVKVRMTLTSPNCPAIETLPAEVQLKVKNTEGVDDAEIELVWEPTWTKELMSDAAKLELNMW
jgi:FeS assembly SUF system protein